MVELHHLLERKGRYQLLTRLPAPPDAAAGMEGYVVTNLAGDVVREAPTLAMARAWMDALVDLDRNPQRARPPRR